MLENLFSQLDKPGLVPAVPPTKNPREPLKPTDGAAVPPVPPEKTKSKTEISEYADSTQIQPRIATNDNHHYCRECSNLNSGSYCIKQRFKPVDDLPRNCGDFIPNGEPASEGLSQPEKNAILRWLTYIGENNPDIISEVMEYCASDPAYREYYLKRSTEVPA